MCKNGCMPMGVASVWLNFIVNYVDAYCRFSASSNF